MRVLVLIVLAVLLSCGPKEPRVEVPVAPPSPSEKVSLQLEPLVRNMPAKDEFALKDEDNPENLPLFIQLAATARDPSLRVAALKAMRHAYPAHATDAYTRAVARNLQSDDPAILKAAMEASSPSLGREASPEVRQQLLRLVHSKNKAIRLAALDTIWQAEPFPTPIFQQALTDPDTLVRGMALLHLVQQRVRDRSFYAPAVKLLAHPDPGVRGKAIELALLTAPNRTSLESKLEPMLSDRHPYVRSQAALGLASLGHWNAVPRLMPLLNDRSANSYELEYINLLGEPERLYFKSLRSRRVDDAALAAISRLSGGRYLYHETHTEEELQHEVQRARRWYRLNYSKD